MLDALNRKLRNDGRYSNVDNVASNCPRHSKSHSRCTEAHTKSMTQDIALQQKSRGEKEHISEGLFKIFDNYLKFSSTKTAVEVARYVAELAPEHEGEELEGFLWSVWGDLIQIAKQIPHDHPAQEKLVKVLRELVLLPETGIKTWDLRLWTDLPILGAALREGLNGPGTSEVKAEQAEIVTSWVNFNAFYARLNGAGVMHSESHSIWMLRAALEEEVPRELLDCRILTAAQILEHNGPNLDLQLRMGRQLDETEARMYQGGSLFKGNSGLNEERWVFWITRFRDLAEKTTTEEVKSAALRAARLMEIWHEGR
ncbi:hypothetical protein BJ170DRAFT_623816 [Xylariales sp. AK1849]|nr:hypothetical protein BJ170DRAFT_623816 [Xylariales sp. AK1849]